MKPKKPARNCLGCGVLIPLVEGVKPAVRCVTCHRVWKRDAARRQRKVHKERMIKEGAPPGWKVCTRCYRKKRLSEYTTNREDGTGRLNKLCDSCLTRIYSTEGRTKTGFCAVYWRQRAYSCNGAHRAGIAVRLGVPTSQIGLKDLPWVCKPQDLVAIFEQQNGSCAYCGLVLTPKNLAVDHAHPRCRGGGYGVDNLLMACDDCNRLKWSRTEVEFRDFLKEYVKRFQVSEREDKKPRG